MIQKGVKDMTRKNILSLCFALVITSLLMICASAEGQIYEQNGVKTAYVASTEEVNIGESSVKAYAGITDAVAATAEPPQIDEPQPINVEIFPGICNTLCNTNAIKSEIVIVHTIIGSDCIPV